jgi:hypothetical protein
MRAKNKFLCLYYERCLAAAPVSSHRKKERKKERENIIFLIQKHLDRIEREQL